MRLGKVYMVVMGLSGSLIMTLSMTAGMSADQTSAQDLIPRMVLYQQDTALPSLTPALQEAVVKLREENERYFGRIESLTDKVLNFLYLLVAAVFSLAVGLASWLGLKGSGVYNAIKNLDDLESRIQKRADEAKREMRDGLLTLIDVLHVELARDLDDDEAINLLQSITSRKQENYLAQYYLGRRLHRNRQYDMAIACFQRCLEIQPGFHEAHERLGYSYNRRDQPAEAIACFMRVLVHEPRNIRCLRNLAYSYNALGRYDEAIKYSKAALEIHPDYVNALNNLGYAYLKTGKLEEAGRICAMVVSRDPTYDYGHYNMARYFTHVRKFDQAIESLGRAIDCGYSLRKYLMEDVDLKELRENHETAPAFQGLLQRMTK